MLSANCTCNSVTGIGYRCQLLCSTCHSLCILMGDSLRLTLYVCVRTLHLLAALIESWAKWHSTFPCWRGTSPCMAAGPWRCFWRYISTDCIDEYHDDLMHLPSMHACASVHYGSDWKHMHASREGALGRLALICATQLRGGEQVFLYSCKIYVILQWLVDCFLDAGVLGLTVYCTLLFLAPLDQELQPAQVLPFPLGILCC